jgi:phosphotransferase system enzyme I (PtsP)
MALIALGYRSLSVSASSIGPLKAMILSLDTAKLTATVERAMERNASVREELQRFASAEGVDLP